MCREEIAFGFSANLFYNSPMVTLLAHRNKMGVWFGAAKSPDRAGTAALVGAADQSESVRRETMRNFQTTVRLLSGLTKGIKRMGVDDTWPSPADTSLAKNLTSVGFRAGGHYVAAMEIPKRIKRYNRETGVFGSIGSMTIKEKIEEIDQTLAYDLLFGQVTDTSQDEWSSVQGVLAACATSTYPWLGQSALGYGDSGTASYWQGNTITSAVTAGLDLVDQANLSYGLQSRGPGIDAMFVSLPAFKRYKQEGQSRAALILQGTRKDRAEWGCTKQAVVYGGILIQPEPFLANYTDTSLNFPGAGPIGTVVTVNTSGVITAPWYSVNGTNPNNLGVGAPGTFTVARITGSVPTGDVTTSPYPLSTLNLDTRGYAIGLTTGGIGYATQADANYSVTPWTEPWQRGVGATDTLAAYIELIPELIWYQRYNNILFANTQGWAA